METKNIILAIVALLVIGGGVYFITQQSTDTVVVVEESTEPSEMTDETNAPTTEDTEDQQPAITQRGGETIIGTSVDGTDIIAYHYGSGETEILLIGGTHGSDAPSTAEVTQRFSDYFASNEAVIPANITVTVIPNLNPDGSADSSAAGRFNANNVDLNRNFDCEWSETGMWRQEEVSGGSAPFSEPEAVALRDYVLGNSIDAAIVWFASEGKVYPSACATSPSNESVELAATFANAAGYPAEAEFDAYAITGDMVNWMAKQNIPAISVLLTNRNNAEFVKNQAGLTAVLNAYAN